MKLRYILLSFFILKTTISYSQNKEYHKDSLLIDAINQKGYDFRLKDPEMTIKLGQKAFLIAEKKGYKNEMGEASRIIGVGYSYLGKSDSSIFKYLHSLSLFKKTNNIEGQAKVYNNIGNLFREVDFNLGLKYFHKSLKLARQAKLEELIAGTFINIGIIYHRKEMHKEALSNFQQSLKIFTKLKNTIGIISSLQNQGVVYYNIKNISRAEDLLMQARKKALENKLSRVIASINLTLTEVYTAKKQFEKAESARDEGVFYSKLAKDKRLEHDFIGTSYELEKKRKNYEKALHYMTELYRADSADFDNAKAEQIKLLDAQFKFQQKEKENQIIIERQKTNKIILIASIIVSLLAFVLVFILVLNIKKKAKTNKLLHTLNEEISIQKENLNKVNHNLEQIIDERTKDLQIKNRKLSEYSSHLSHQIRGPVATMKGLMILEKESLIEDKDFIFEMSKCVNEVDDRIININEVLNNISQPGLIPKTVDKENNS